MKVIYSLAFVTLILVGCEKQDIVSGSRLTTPSRFSHLTWELMEIRNLSGEWRTVTPEEKHFLIFVSEDAVTYSDTQKECDGQFTFETIDNSIVPERLTLKVPCMVPAEQLWWEYPIEEKSESEVIVYPQLNPTALMQYQRFKYRITKQNNNG